MDFSAAAITIAKRRAAQARVPVTFQQEDAQSLSFPDAQFDHVVTCECLEHVLRPDQMTAEIFRVLKPGGTFCLTAPNYLNGSVIAWLYCWLTGRPLDTGSGVQPNENFFVFWTVRHLLKSAGLVIDRSQSSHVQWLLLPRVDPARLRTDYFSSEFARLLTKPFGMHFSFFGHKPEG